MTTSLIRRARTRLASEQGSMMVAVIVLMVVSTLAAAVVASAVQTNTSTRHDANYKNAAEAAEAGLQIALYRLNMLNLQSSNNGCLGDGFLSSPNDGSWCSSSQYGLGNGSFYVYYTTPVLGTGGKCAGLTVLGNDVTERCITAIGTAGVGTANSASARSQIRVAAFAAAPLFPVAGVIGVNSVTLTGNASVTGSSGSNGVVSLSGNATSHGVVLGPNGAYTHSGNSSGGTVSAYPGGAPISLNPVDPGSSNQTLLANCPSRQAAGLTTCNDDYRITNGINNANGTNHTTVSPYDGASNGGVSFNAATRVLSISGNGSLQLGGGLYNFCELDMSGNASLSIATGVQAEIFIDSPTDTGSGCGSNTGNLSLSGNGAVNPSQNPLSLQLYVYGGSKTTASLSGNGNFYGLVYAPNSDVSVSGNGVVSGALAGRTVNISGNGFNWDSRAGTVSASTNGLYYRTAWAQCTPAPTTSDPGSGCG
jgi:hypothetical protein